MRRQGLDVAFWYMADARYSNKIVEKFKAGLPVACDGRPG